jgi:hypothetical protein
MMMGGVRNAKSIRVWWRSFDIPAAMIEPPGAAFRTVADNGGPAARRRCAVPARGCAPKNAAQASNPAQAITVFETLARAGMLALVFSRLTIPFLPAGDHSEK